MNKEMKSNILKKLAETLMEAGFTTQLQKEEDAGMETLRMVFVLKEQIENPVAMDIAFYQTDEPVILQFYTYLNLGTDQEKYEKFAAELEEANQIAPIGHYGFYGEERQAYYRYCAVLGEIPEEAAVEHCILILNLIFSILSANYEKFS